MKKNFTYLSYHLTFSLLWSLLLLSSCTASRFASNASIPKEAAYIPASKQNSELNNAVASNQVQPFITASAEITSHEDVPAAASVRPETEVGLDIDTYAHPAEIIRAPVAQTTLSTQAPAKATLSRQVQKKVSLPARMLMKSIVKKAEKLQKKDITNTGEQKEVNNRSYLVLGILLLVAGLALVLVGNTALLYVLGSVASLAGLVFLLLAIL